MAEAVGLALRARFVCFADLRDFMPVSLCLTANRSTWTMFESHLILIKKQTGFYPVRCFMAEAVGLALRARFVCFADLRDFMSVSLCLTANRSTWTLFESHLVLIKKQTGFYPVRCFMAEAVGFEPTSP